MPGEAAFPDPIVVEHTASTNLRLPKFLITGGRSDTL